MWKWNLLCIVLFTVAMAGVRYYAHHIGVIGGLLTIAAMYGAAVLYERRKQQARIEIIPPGE